MSMTRQATNVAAMLCLVGLVVVLMAIRTGSDRIFSAFDTPKKTSTVKPETQAERQARERKSLIAGSVGLVMLLGFAGFAFYRWFRETNEILEAPERDPRLWDGL